jgi:hypothetical protein
VVPLTVFDGQLPALVRIATFILTVWPQLKPVQSNDLFSVTPLDEPL